MGPTGVTNTFLTSDRGKPLYYSKKLSCMSKRGSIVYMCSSVMGWELMFYTIGTQSLSVKEWRRQN